MQDGALQIYAKIGIGNATFCNTEIERGVLEHRIKGFSSTTQNRSALYSHMD